MQTAKKKIIEYTQGEITWNADTHMHTHREETENLGAMAGRERKSNICLIGAPEEESIGLQEDTGNM